ncbi:DUF106 domain-containing protein [Candidatus Woesearchaeota archaeon]|nr:DUF106 domain-containing protein [Candidatus Woesearchaeota archaeon]
MAFSLDPVLGWLLYLDPALAILIVSLIVSLITSLALKLLTDQTLMKDLKEEQKELQKEMKELKNNPNKLAKVNERFMETNMKYMSHSMRPTLFTFLPIILVFGWLSSHIGYYPILPGENFQLTALFEKDAEGEIVLEVPDGIQIVDEAEKEVLHEEVDWLLKGDEGEYELLVKYKDKEYLKNVIITNERKYAPVEKDFKKRILFFSSSDENGLNKLELSNEKILPFENVPVVKDLPWISGWGWFGSYIFFSLIFSMSLRRLMNIY